MKIQNYLWAFPFICFLLGYLMLKKISNLGELPAPSLVGKKLQDAVTILSEKNLNLRILAQKNDADLPQGTILSQTPAAKQLIKPHQALHIVLSKKPEKQIAPQLIGNYEKTIETLLQKNNIRYKKQYLPSNCPKNSCIAQHPATGKPLEDNKIILYLSSGNSKPVLLPDFSGKPVPEITTFLNQYENIDVCITHSPKTSNHICDQTCIITQQRPLAGSLVTLNAEKPLLVQLQAKRGQKAL